MALPPSLEVAPDAHWGDLSAVLEDSITAGLETGSRGITITAPTEIPLGSRATLPLSGVRVCTFREVARVPLHAAMIVASCIETGEVRAEPLVGAPDESRPDDGSDPGSGSSGASFTLDLFVRPGIPQKPSTWVVRVLLHDQQSNALTIALKPSPTRFHDPAADELVRAMLRKPVLRPLNPRPSLGPGLPSYEPTPETPPMPAEPGVVLSMARALLIEPGAKLVVRGAFRGSILPRDVRPPPAKDAAVMRGPRATAVLPMTLLAMRSHRVGALNSQLVIPSYQPVEGEGDALFGSACFALDFFQLTDFKPEPQTLFIYAFAGQLMSNLAPCALVHPSALHGN